MADLIMDKSIDSNSTPVFVTHTQSDIEPLPLPEVKEDTTIKEFDINVKKLLSLSMEIHDAANGKMSNPSLWMVRISKFQSAYTKTKNPPGFLDMWRNFYTIHNTELTDDIFVETEESSNVNDKWLKDITEREKKGEVKQSNSWNPRQMTCKGIVIYFNPEVKSVSIPIGEIYLAAIKLSKEKGKDNIKMYSYPAQLLSCLYNILDKCILDSDPGKKQISKNTKILGAFLQEITISDADSNSNVGEGMNGFAKIMSTVMKTVGINMPEDGNMEKTIKETFESDGAKKIGKVVGKMIESVNSSQNKGGGLENIIDGIGNACKDPEIKSIFNDMIPSTQKTSETRTSVIDDIDRPSINTSNVSITLPMPSGENLPSSQE